MSERVTQAKEAVKTALAVVLVYGIALKTGWMNPYWGAFVVVLIALPSPGASLQKGLLRLGGTIPGCFAAIAILSLAPQNRWVFLLLMCGWIFATTYLSLRDAKRSYLWFTAGLTALVIGSSPDSSEQLFRLAMFRTLETDLGIMVYMLVSILVWPRTETDAAPAAAPATPAVPPIAPSVIDLDAVRGSAFAALATAIGFVVWVLFDPPGHTGWFVLPGALSMVIARLPQLRITVFVKPLAIAIPLAMAVYIFVLPRLTTFGELAMVIFTLLFVNLMFNKGIAQVAGNIAIINIIAIQNHQVYVFAPIANVVLFLFGGFYFVFALSYLMSSARPEKAMLGLVDRFFRNASYLISHPQLESDREPPLIRRWMIHHSRHDLLTIPQKIRAWGASIDPTLFPGNAPERVGELAASLEGFGQSLDTFLEAERTGDSTSIPADLRREIAKWRSECCSSLTSWWESGSSESVEEQTVEPTEDQEERELVLVDHFRAVTAAAASYAATASEIDWDHWREERFS